MQRKVKSVENACLDKFHDFICDKVEEGEVASGCIHTHQLGWAFATD